MEPFHTHGRTTLVTFFRRGKRASRTVSAGFTLIELLVVFTIVMVIMGIVLSSQSTFNKTFILTNTAYDVALSLRNAETYGLASRTAGSTVNAGHGLHFQSGTASSYILFADTSPSASCGTPDCKPGDHVYTSGSDAIVRTYTFGNGITVSDFCSYNGSWSCKSTTGLTSLDIVFSRPNPDPFVSVNGAYSALITKACLKLASPQSVYRYVSVLSSGEITANAASCP